MNNTLQRNIRQSVMDDFTMRRFHSTLIMRASSMKSVVNDEQFCRLTLTTAVQVN